MTTAERGYMNELCKCILEEHDPKKFQALLEDLNELFENTVVRNRLENTSGIGNKA